MREFDLPDSHDSGGARPSPVVWRRRLLSRLRGLPSRRWLVRHGLSVGRDVYIHEQAHFDHGFLWLISIGDESTITAGVRILAHDASPKRSTGYTRVGRVDIGRRVFIGANAIVLPGVKIGDDVIVGAGSVVREDVRPGVVVMGNPAVEVATQRAFTAKHGERIAERPCYPREGFSSYEHVSAENVRRMRSELASECGYIE
jgi:maltose O-acetyltransferase